MFVRSIIRREARTFAEAVEKTAMNTKGDAGSEFKSAMAMGTLICFPCVLLGINTAFPPTRKVSACPWYRGTDNMNH